MPEAYYLLTHWIDHIVAEKHGGRSTEGNLALSCVLCNQHKGSDLTSLDPLTGLITPLFHPRNDTWSDHFLLIDGAIEARSPVGRVTVRLLVLNHPDRIEERKLLQQFGLLE